MDKESFSIKIMISTKETLKIIKKMDMECINGVMELNTKDYGKRIRDRV
jgi:hypothetical protein